MKRLGLFLLLGGWTLTAGVLVNPYRFAAPYVAGTAVSDGTNDIMTYTGAMTGMADGQVFTFSLWYLDLGGDGTARTLVEFEGAGDARRFRVEHTTANTINVSARNSALVTVLSISSTNTITTSTGWVCIGCCVTLNNTSLRKIYFNTTAETLVVTTYDTSGTIDFLADSSPAYNAFANSAALNDTNGAMAEFWFDLSYLDDPTKFQAGGKPISLGGSGTVPTGSQPVIYCKDSGNSFATNYGTGEDFTVTGTLGTTTPP